MIPINLAFFYRDSASGKMMAMYPSPAGATESLLSLESWGEIAAQNSALQAWSRMSKHSWSTAWGRHENTSSLLSMSVIGWSA